MFAWSCHYFNGLYTFTQEIQGCINQWSIQEVAAIILLFYTVTHLMSTTYTPHSQKTAHPITLHTYSFNLLTFCLLTYTHICGNTPSGLRFVDSLVNSLLCHKNGFVWQSSICQIPPQTGGLNLLHTQGQGGLSSPAAFGELCGSKYCK